MCSYYTAIFMIYDCILYTHIFPLNKLIFDYTLCSYIHMLMLERERERERDRQTDRDREVSFYYTDL